MLKIKTHSGFDDLFLKYQLNIDESKLKVNERHVFMSNGVILFQ